MDNPHTGFFEGSEPLLRQKHRWRWITPTYFVPKGPLQSKLSTILCCGNDAAYVNGQLLPSTFFVKKSKEIQLYDYSLTTITTVCSDIHGTRPLMSLPTPLAPL